MCRSTSGGYTYIYISKPNLLTLSKLTLLRFKSLTLTQMNFYRKESKDFYFQVFFISTVTLYEAKIIQNNEITFNLDDNLILATSTGRCARFKSSFEAFLTGISQQFC